MQRSGSGRFICMPELTIPFSVNFKLHPNVDLSITQIIHRTLIGDQAQKVIHGLNANILSNKQEGLNESVH
jgi:hypothetical protein